MLYIDERRYRPSTLNDLYDLSRLCDTLAILQWFTRPVVATDIEIKTRTEVLMLRPTTTNGWLLETSDGEVHAEQVVLEASFWTRELVEPLGLQLPLYALEHHEVITEALPELAALDFEVPTVRVTLTHRRTPVRKAMAFSVEYTRQARSRGPLTVFHQTSQKNC